MRSLRTLLALVRFYFRIVPTRWYLRRPFLPIPSRKYLAWRLRTAYGGHSPSRGELLRDVWQFGAWLAAFDGSNPGRR